MPDSSHIAQGNQAIKITISGHEISICFQVDHNHKLLVENWLFFPCYVNDSEAACESCITCDALQINKSDLYCTWETENVTIKGGGGWSRGWNEKICKWDILLSMPGGFYDWLNNSNWNKSVNSDK